MSTRISDVYCVKQTEKAILVDIRGDEYWIPLSVITTDSEVFDETDNAEGDLVIADWFAAKEGLD